MVFKVCGIIGMLQLRRGIRLSKTMQQTEEFNLKELLRSEELCDNPIIASIFKTVLLKTWLKCPTVLK